MNRVHRVSPVHRSADFRSTGVGSSDADIRSPAGPGGRCFFDVSASQALQVVRSPGAPRTVVWSYRPVSAAWCARLASSIASLAGRTRSRGRPARAGRRTGRSRPPHPYGLFEVPVGQPVPQVPAHRQQDHLGRETEPVEPRRHPHRRPRTASALHRATLTATVRSVNATEPARSPEADRDRPTRLLRICRVPLRSVIGRGARSRSQGPRVCVPGV